MKQCTSFGVGVSNAKSAKKIHYKKPKAEESRTGGGEFSPRVRRALVCVESVYYHPNI